MIQDPNSGTAIILAAGFSTRFGSDKRNFRISGQTLLSCTLRLYIDVFDDVVVVTRESDVDLLASIEQTVEVVRTSKAEQGMSQSLIAGIDAASDAPWVVIALADMPFVRQETLKLLKQMLELNQDCIVRLMHDHRYGNPVGFPRCYFSHLRGLSGDQGARDLFLDDRVQVETIQVSDEGILIDIDTPDQMEKYRNLLAANMS